MMSRNMRIILIVLGVFLVVGLILPRLVNVNSFRPKLEAELSDILGREVKVGNLSLSVFSGTVSADNISIADDPAFGKDPFVTAKSFKAGVKVMPLIFSKSLRITEISLDEPQITLLRGPGGTWNFSTIGKGSAAAAAPQEKAEKSGMALSVDKLNVRNGRLLTGTANSATKPSAWEKVNLEVSNFSATSQFPFILGAALSGGGEISLKGRCGPLKPAEMAGTPLDAAMKVEKLDLAAAGSVTASMGMEGLADFDGVVTSDGRQLKGKGSLEMEKLKVAAKGKPMQRALSAKYAFAYDPKTQAGTLEEGDVAIGKAVTRFTGTWQAQESGASFKIRINGSGMPIDDLEAALPALGVVLPSGSKLQGGALSLDLSLDGSAGNAAISGPIRLANSKLAGFDFGSKASAIPGLGGRGGDKDLVLQNFSTTVRVSSENTRADAINVNVPSLGVVTGAGTVSPSGALNFDMSANLGGDAGRGVSFGIEGTTSDPKFVPDVKSMAGKAISRKVTGGEQEGGRTGKLGRRR